MKSKNVVTIGGGTGSFTLLSGLKKYPLNITAIVSVADDGGSTGRLRDELGVLPPGDVRKCLVALCDSSKVLRELMDYHFENGDLKGHSFGNIFLSALEKIKGNFADGIIEAAKILNIKGKVIPVSNSDMRIDIELNNGKHLRGEHYLDYNEQIHKIGIKGISLEKKVKACRSAIEQIQAADFIVIGPGDHYGSLLPNLLVRDIAEAIEKSQARVIYNCNLTNKKGQTDGYDVDRYVKEINKYIGKDRIDFVIYNKTLPSKGLIKKYERLEGKNMIVVLNNKQEERSFKLVSADLIHKKKVIISLKELLTRKHSFIRHDSDKLAKAVNGIIADADRKKVEKKGN